LLQLQEGAFFLSRRMKRKKKELSITLLKCTTILFLLTFQSFGKISNFRLLADTRPDFSTMKNAALSMTRAWATEEQKALAIWRWIANSRFQVSTVRDSQSFAEVPTGRVTYGAIYDPIVLNNSYSNYFCTVLASTLGLIWQELGGTGQENDIKNHSVPDLYFDGGYHMFDAAYGYYFRDPVDRHILSVEEIMARRTQPLNKITSPVTTVSRLLGAGVNESVYDRNRVYMLFQNDYSDYVGYGGINPEKRFPYNGTKYTWNSEYFLSFRQGESYTKTWTQIDPGDRKYFLPTQTFSDSGPNPNEGGENIQSNGIWVYNPDLSDPAFLSENGGGAGLAQGGSVALHPASNGTVGEIVLYMNSLNAISHAVLEGEYSRQTGDVVQISFSADGNVWYKIWEGTGTGTTIFAKDFGKQSGTPSNLARSRYGYYLKIKLSSSSNSSSVGLKNLKITTFTILNRRNIPRLDLGNNNITFDFEGSPLQGTEVVYYWTEYHRQGDSFTTKKRSHKKSISDSLTDWQINVDGYRHPVMDSVAMRHSASSSLGNGYSDGQDVGSDKEGKRYFLTLGINISHLKTTTSVPVVSNIKVVTDNQLSADGSLDGAGWAKVENPVITIDLGSSKTVGGVRIGQQTRLLDNRDYADSVVFYTSDDNSTWTRRGKVEYSELWFPAFNYLYDNFWDGPGNETKKNAGIAMHIFNAAFDSSILARYVRSNIYNSLGDINIGEIEIHDAMVNTPIAQEILHLTANSPNSKKQGLAKQLKNKMILKVVPTPFLHQTTIRVRPLQTGLTLKHLAIYNLKGQKVKDFDVGTAGGRQDFEITWNGEDSKQNRVPAGVYLVFAELSGGSIHSIRVVLRR